MSVWTHIDRVGLDSSNTIHAELETNQTLHVHNYGALFLSIGLNHTNTSIVITTQAK
jgi:hypothetical protein